jgi:hypothetical protein
VIRSLAGLEALPNLQLLSLQGVGDVPPEQLEVLRKRRVVLEIS